MTFEEISELWQVDCEVDNSDLDEESRKTPRLHSKYYRLYYHEKVTLKKLQKRYDILYLDKYEFFTQGPAKEDADKGWKLPAKGVVLKNEVDKYMDADKDLVNLSLKIEIQKEVVDFLTSIIDQINARQWNIKNTIEYMKFKNGVG